LLRKLSKLIIIPLFLVPQFAIAAEENPDELFRAGRFKEAEEAYARADMDRPRDIRFRYNRGCAAYRGSDFQSAQGAFSSVVSRTEDDRIKFKALYNLGNTEFRQGDFKSAAGHFKEALMFNPESEDAAYNLELALRQMEKAEKDQQKKKKDDGGEKPLDRKKSSGGEPDKKDQGQNQKAGDPKDPEPQQPNEKGDREKKGRSDQEKESGQKENEGPDRDLSGELRASDDMPQEQKEGQPSAARPQAMLDRTKAEALLDNLKEDRSRFMRFQVPRGKRDGVKSGKDW
jgi:Ca-activated chloride channel homolog